MGTGKRIHFCSARTVRFNGISRYAAIKYMGIIMNKFLKFLLGTFCALAISFIVGCVLFRLFTGMNPLTGWAIFVYNDVAAKVFSICAIPNIVLFYLFLNRYNYYSTCGVIFSFICIGLYLIFGR